MLSSHANGNKIRVIAIHTVGANKHLSESWIFCRLRKDMQNIIKILRSDIGEEKGSVENRGGDKKESEEDGGDSENAEADGLVIITALVTSCIRCVFAVFYFQSIQHKTCFQKKNIMPLSDFVRIFQLFVLF
jgi:hypothetical protein